MFVSYRRKMPQFPSISHQIDGRTRVLYIYIYYNNNKDYINIDILMTCFQHRTNYTCQRCHSTVDHE